MITGAIVNIFNEKLVIYFRQNYWVDGKLQHTLELCDFDWMTQDEKHAVALRAKARCECAAVLNLESSNNMKREQFKHSLESE